MKPPQLSGKRITWPMVVMAVFAFAVVVIFADALIHAYRSAKISSAISTKSQDVRKADLADLALISYMGDHGDRYPSLAGDLTSTLKPYLDDPKVVDSIHSYVWNTKWSGRKATDIDGSEEEWILYSTVPGSSMIVVGFASGHVMPVSRQYLEKVVLKRDEVIKEHSPSK